MIDLFLFVVRIIIQIVCYIFCYLGIVVFNGKGSWNRWLGKHFLWFSNFNKVVVDGFDRFISIKNTDRKFLVVVNHVTLYDGFVLMATLGELGFLSSKEGAVLIPGMTDILKSFNSIIQEKGKQTTQQIIEHVAKRKSGDNPLVLFADAMKPVPKGKNIAPFKTGAFVGKFDILPVVIKYKNYKIDPKYRWYDDENHVLSVWKMLLDGHCDIHVKVLEPVSCGNLSVEQYKDKVYNIMDKAYIDI